MHPGQGRKTKNAPCGGSLRHFSSFSHATLSRHRYQQQNRDAWAAQDSTKSIGSANYWWAPIPEDAVCARCGLFWQGARGASVAVVCQHGPLQIRCLSLQSDPNLNARTVRTQVWRESWPYCYNTSFKVRIGLNSTSTFGSNVTRVAVRLYIAFSALGPTIDIY